MVVYTINLKKILKPLKIIAFTLLFAIFTVFTIRTLIISDYEVASAESERVIIIDAGHGGEDPGAIGITGVYEKDVNLSIALALGEELKSKGYTVVYTRTEDKMLYLPEENIKGMRKISDLKNRCKITAEYENCIFVSIHMNSYGASKYSGLQVYYANENDESKALAHKIQSMVKKDLQPENNRQIKNGKSLYLLENASGTPVLIECGFLSNETECQKLSQKEYQKELSFSISCAIIEYINEISGTI
jgi:N-acetylmuramoyl-L-alanine amidase